MQAANGDVYLSNLLRLLTLLDANDDASDGFQIDAAANTAIDAAVTGTKTLDFAASAASFENDAIVQAPGHAPRPHAASAPRKRSRATSCCSASRAPRASRSPATTRAPWS